MVIVKSLNNIPVRLSTDISNPEIVLKGNFGEFLAVRLFSDTPLTEKYLVVAYKEVSENDGFVLTAYFTNKPAERREVIWRR